jgi:signal transduction histidine kinase
MLTPTPQSRSALLLRPAHARQQFWGELAMLVGVNLLITILLILTRASTAYAQTLIVCNAIGFGIWGSYKVLRVVSRDRSPLFLNSVIAVPGGFILGSKFAALLGTPDIIALAVHDPIHEGRLLLGCLIIAIVATSFIIFYWHAAANRADLHSERRRAAEALQSETQAKLALLQAQIEPHFLFNTLANVQSVIESDPKTAKSILENLNQYLRVSLGRTRRPSSTLADELSLVSALLAIAAIRLGERLRYVIDVPEALQMAQLPPLLLQPLVENALKHGIEPAVNGGEIRVAARLVQGALHLSVTDTGVGLDASSPEGVGLANVRGRLESLYGRDGTLAIHVHEPHGVLAEITMPLVGI